jgi:hypothetical protein
MMNELFARVDALEKKLAAPVVRIEHVIQPEAAFTAPAVAAPSRKMCPKCGVKPAYFFHVRTCPGQKEEQNDADQNTVRRRDQGTP